MTKEIWFDMDGTIANLYAVEGWLNDLRSESTRPYDMALPMLNFSLFARLLNQLQRDGWKIGIISWTAKNGNETYNMAVEMAKRAWLAKHLPSVEWDEIRVVRYGTNKWETCRGGILFDDEEQNRAGWKETAYTPDMIVEILKELRERG